MKLSSIFIKKYRSAGLLWIALVAVSLILPGRSWSALQFVEAQYGGPVLDGACGLATSPDGNHLYAAGYYNGVIAVFSRNSTNGELTLTGIQRDGVDSVDGLDSAMDVTVSPDGRHLYAVGEWDDGLAVFSRDTTTGQLTFVEVQKEGVGGVDGLNGISSLAVSPDGYYLYGAGRYDSAVAVFGMDSDNDGILDIVEEAGPNAGDGNGDGLLDSRQSHVVTLQTYDRANYVTLAAPAGTTLSNCRATDNPSSADSPANADFTYGFFEFTINGVAQGGSTTLALYLPAGAGPETYYKYGPAPGNPDDHWYEFPYDNQTGAQISQNVVTLHFTDGLRGDDGLIADGMIVDIGGPAFGTEDEESGGTETSGTSSGSSSGGCFLTALHG